MKKMFPITFLTAVAMVTVLAVAPASARDRYDWAQIKQWPEMMGGTWKWSRETLKAELPFGPNAPQPPLLPEIRAKYAESIANPAGDTACRPSGMPYAMVFINSFSVFYTRNEVIQTYQGDVQYRRIYLDGRGHGGADVSYNGHSTGHWEGDTLVVDTAAIEPKATLVPGVPQGEGSHLVERFRLTGPDTLDYDMVIENPKLQSGRWRVHRVFTRDRKLEIEPDFCENNREDGGVLNLTPPPPYRP